MADIRLPHEWIVEMYRYDDGKWEPSPSFYEWLDEVPNNLRFETPPPRTLDECLEFLSIPLKRGKKLSPTDGQYRVRNLRTGEIIPGDIFDVPEAD